MFGMFLFAHLRPSRGTCLSLSAMFPFVYVSHKKGTTSCRYQFFLLPLHPNWHVPFACSYTYKRIMPSTTAMKIYLKYNAESEKYAPLMTNVLQKAGHGVFVRGDFHNDQEAIQACHLCLDMTNGELVESTKPKADIPSAPKRLRKDVDDRVAKLVLVLGEKALPRRQLIAELGLKQKSRRVFTYNYWKPSWERGLIDFAFTAVPHKPEQAYRLTAKGLELYTRLTTDEAE